MTTKKTLGQQITTTLIILFIMAIIPTLVAASKPVAGHRADRKVILIGGYDACNNSLTPICPSDPIPNPGRVHDRDSEHPKWSPIIDFLTKSVVSAETGGFIENELVRLIDLKDGDFDNDGDFEESDIFILSYALGDNKYEKTTGTNQFDFGRPKYTAIDTCLSENKLIPRFGLYCQVEKSEIKKVVQNISEIMNDPRYNNAEFDIISFSEGGAVATYWTTTANPDLLKRVNTVITIDSPLLGDVFIPYTGIKVAFMADEVLQALGLAPTKVPLYTIRNTKDNVVPWDEATLAAVWNDSGSDISTEAPLINHDVRPNIDVQKRVALALVSGKVISPSTENKQVVNRGSPPLPFLVRIAKPAFVFPNSPTFPTAIDSVEAGVNIASGGSFGYTTGGITRLQITPPDLADGTYDLTVDSENTHLPTILDTEINSIVYGPTPNIDVVLTIDRSFSMSPACAQDPACAQENPTGEDRIREAKKAGKLFVDFMRNGDKVGVVGFKDVATAPLQLTTIDGVVRAQAKTAIDSFIPDDGTSIAAGLQKALEELESPRADPLHPHVIVLISDGRETIEPFVDDVLLQALQQAGVAVFTIGLGSNADVGLLQRISSATGGQFRFAPSATELLEIYNAIFATVSGQQSVFVGSGTVQQGETVQQATALDSTIAKATFSATWGGSDLDLVLVTPSGAVIDPATAISDPNIEFVSGSTFEFYRIKSPEAGNWLIRVIGTTVDTVGGEPFTTRVTVEAGLLMLAGTNRDSYQTFDPIHIFASLADNQPVVGANISALIRTPLGVSQLTLFDDGAHHDGSATDGTYANLFEETSMDGIYSVEIQAQGISNIGESFTRVAEKDVLVEQSPAPPADLFIRKTGPAEVAAGSDLVYTITYGNNGPGIGVQVMLSDLIPEGTTIVGDTLGGGTELDGAGMIWSAGDLAPGFERTFEFTVSIPLTMEGAITNAVSINSAPTDLTVLASSDPDFDNNSATVATQVEPPPSKPVGGITTAPSKAGLLVPWLGLVALLGLVAGAVWRRRMV